MIDPAFAFQTVPRPALATSEKIEIDGWTVPGDLPYVDGHFPGRPILPAIGILDASLLILQRSLNQPRLSLTRVDSAKFTSPIEPGVRVRIEMRKTAADEWDVQWMDEARKPLASLRVHTST